MKLRKRWFGKKTYVSNQPTPFVEWIWISTRSFSIQCCWGAFWREIILAHEKNNLLYLLIFQSPFLPFFFLSLLSFFPRSSRVVVMVNRCHGERASKTRVTPGTFYQSFYYLSKSCQKELKKRLGHQTIYGQIQDGGWFRQPKQSLRSNSLRSIERKLFSS